MPIIEISSKLLFSSHILLLMFSYTNVIRRLSALFKFQLEKELSFLKQHSTAICADRYIGLGRTVDAGMLYIEKGQLTVGIALLITDTQDRAAMRKACECLISALWQQVSLGSYSWKPARLEELLQLTEKFPANIIGEQEHQDVSDSCY